MEYRGKQFTVVQGITPESWKWSVQHDETTVKGGVAETRQKAIANAVRAIDQGLRTKKVKLAPPDPTDY
jgi:hypothetical protein